MVQKRQKKSLEESFPVGENISAEQSSTSAPEIVQTNTGQEGA